MMLSSLIQGLVLTLGIYCMIWAVAIGIEQKYWQKTYRWIVHLAIADNHEWWRHR